MTSPKLDHLLEAAVKSLAAADPAYLLDVVVTPRTPGESDRVVQHVVDAGGSVTRVDAATVAARLPAGQIERVAAAEEVAAMRLARTHRLH